PEEKRERYVVIEEIKMCNDNNWRKVYKNLNSSMYEAHPYKREVIGTDKIIAGISQDEIISYYKTFYIPENITTIVVGEFNEDEMINLIKENFKFKEMPEIKKVETDEKIPEYQIKNPKTTIDYAEVNTGYIMMGALCDSAKNLKETIALDLISTILGEGKSSRLYNNLVESVSEPHYYQIESCHYQFKDGDNILIEANFETSKKDIVI
ncbi:MAG: insulinase family protein, partial [Candidatus Gastranaerophilales bacterium]|nr:insulinase family protein [Candidatus Gastranaerophilales bacterium]